MISELAEKAIEEKIKSGEGIVPKYISSLRKGNDEEKTLSHILLKTIVKPKFYEFLKNKGISNETKITDALTQYKSREKLYKNPKEKALSILKDLGYSEL